ncbi:class I SAM-dependent methyltransferase [Roseivirga pacifica]|uniref:class I SAM-dependent methyltransferase n=1 Tax=Roseivirga pacifica TaxID=1267423 RepID=UPI00227D2904|nr:class I SAM-dependent methyltransferase [Roseivirga pacifica]
MIDQLASPEVQAFIRAHLAEDPASLMLKKNQYPDLPMRAVVEQIASKQKAKHKLPSWYQQEGILFPPALSMEQASSERTATYKASLVKGKSMVDLTGGFGIDCYFLSKSFRRGVYVERQERLTQIAAHNYKVLGANVEVVHAQSEDYLATLEPVDLIYLDPARRDDHNKKVVLLEDYAPNVLELMPLLQQKAKQVLLKVSPLLDIKLAIEQLSHVATVHVVAVQNEVKELLFLLDYRVENEPTIHCVNFSKTEAQHYQFSLNEEELREAIIGDCSNFLYEPNASILKAGAFKSIAEKFGLKKLHANTHLYTSEVPVADFPGRVFKVKSEISLNKKYLKKTIPDLKVNITVRNYPQSVAQIRKKTGLKEGGANYVLAFTGLNGPTALLCEKQF